MLKFYVTIFSVILSSLAIGQQKLSSADLADLHKRMTGSFSSAAQAAKDSAFFDIRLQMTSIWTDRTDGFWLYVEQAVASALTKPYRQRIYHVYQENDTTMASKVYEISSPLRFAGGGANPAMFNSLTLDSLIDRKGCAIYLHKNKEGNYTGSTPGKECLSSLRGATYATSEVVIYADKLISWDRGWDNADKQVWGAIKGGYEFVKVKN